VHSSAGVRTCTWSSGLCRLVTFRLRFDSHRGSFASNLEHFANLLCDQVNSASYPQRDGKWVVAYGLQGECLVWLIGVVVCLLAANRGSNCSIFCSVLVCERPSCNRGCNLDYSVYVYIRQYSLFLGLCAKLVLCRMLQLRAQHWHLSLLHSKQ